MKKLFYVDLWLGCAVISAESKERAEKYAKNYFGLVNFKSIREKLKEDAELEFALAMGAAVHEI